MRYLLLFALLCLQPLYAQKRCPSNFDGEALQLIQTKIKKHVGETVAFDGEVVTIEKGYNNIPYFSVKLDNGQVLWIASMVSDKYVVPKAKLRLLGYLDLVASDDAIAQQYNKTGFHVRVFATLDHTTKQMQLSNAFEAEVKEWVSGKIPKDNK